MATIAIDLVPPNVKGKPSDLEFTVTLPSWLEAHECFKLVMVRLLNPNLWHDLAGWASANFLLVDAKGQELKRFALEGDHLRIDIPGPGPMQGHGFDWVIIERAEEYSEPSGEHEWVGMKVRPSAEPGKAGAVAHFFESDASSTFIIERFGNKVISRYHGRNEVPNTSTGRPLDNLRHAMVAAGAMISFSEVQWTALCKGFISPKKTNGPV